MGGDELIEDSENTHNPLASELLRLVTPKNFKTIITSILNDGFDKKPFLAEITPEDLFLLLVNRLNLLQLGDNLEVLRLVNQLNLLTTENPNESSVCRQLALLTNNTKALLDFQTTIPRIIANRNEIKASILVYLWKYKVAYPGLVIRYQPVTPYGTRISNNSYYSAFENLSEKGILYQVDPRSEIFRDRRRYLEHVTKRVGKSNNPQHIKKWYAVTKVARSMLQDNIEGLKGVLPSSVLHNIMTKDIADMLGHTHYEISEYDGKRAKETRDRVDSIISDISNIKGIPQVYVLQMVNDIAKEQCIAQIDAAERLFTEYKNGKK